MDAYGGDGRERSKTRVQRAQEELMCSICIEFFKQPRSLACQHTFCHECLELLAASSKASSSGEVVISCPECRANIILPENGVEGKHSSARGSGTKVLCHSPSLYMVNIGGKRCDNRSGC